MTLLINYSVDTGYQRVKRFDRLSHAIFYIGVIGEEKEYLQQIYCWYLKD